MALSLYNRPVGYILQSTEFCGTTANYYGEITISYPGHGLVTGDVVYITKGSETIQGAFWFVYVIHPDFFQLRESTQDDEVDFIATGSVCFKKTSNPHYWSAVNLPITYRLRSNLWPTNEVDPTRTITTISNDNGYFRLNVSGDLRNLASYVDVQAGHYIKVSGATSSEVNGVFKITQARNDADITIALTYDGSYSWTGATVQFYYYLYNTSVKIYGGLPGTHPLTGQKSYELLATVQLYPDASNEVIFSVSDILKEQIEIKNEINSGTYPNTLSQWTAFYIEFAEGYDNAGTTYLSSYTSDSATPGYAVNSFLPFKNVYSGFMSEYLMATAGKFLTMFSTPVFFSGCGDEDVCYFDLSFIPNTTGSLVLRQTYYLNSVQQSTTDIAITDQGAGLYRVQLDEPSCNHDRIDVTLLVSGSAVSETKTITIDCGCSGESLRMTWLNPLGGFDYWVFKAEKDHSIDITQSIETNTNLLLNWPKSYGSGSDTLDRLVKRESKKTVTVRSQMLTEEQVIALSYLKTSPLVQILDSRYDRRTVLVDNQSFQVYTESDKVHYMTFTINYTDLIGSQS